MEQIFFIDIKKNGFYWFKSCIICKKYPSDQHLVKSKLYNFKLIYMYISFEKYDFKSLYDIII